ncbi:MAG: signal recognition particle-docking protein FtsY [Belnapia sp.]|nr:signal recognition particle-docking protein FtsY [Belnapia sp.]
MALKDWLGRLRGKAPEPEPEPGPEPEVPPSEEARLTTPPGQLPEPTVPQGAPTLPPAASPAIPVPPLAPVPPPFTAPAPLERLAPAPAPGPAVLPRPDPEVPPSDDAAALREVQAREAAEAAAKLDAAPEPVTEPEPEPEPAAEPAAVLEPSGGWFARLRTGLSRSTARLTDSVTALFRKRRLDETALEELEETLIAADLGVAAAGRIVEGFRRTRFGKEVTDDEVKAALAEAIAEILGPVALPMPIEPGRAPHVVLVVGVNGTGKTTTIAKLGQQYREQGLRCAFVAGDTFRAAAVEQLQIWGDRTGARVHAPAKQGADAAGLAFDALTAARTDGTQVLLVDTAGRLHNKSALMEELRKVIRVMRRVDPTAPHSVLLVLDATTGQNAVQQVKVFGEMVDVTGLAVTKLDGSAKGGVVVALAQEFGLPVHFVGVGEKAADLRPFAAKDYARGLMGLD